MTGALTDRCQIHPEFYYKGVSSMDVEQGVLAGRPFGGLGILWKKSLASSCEVIEYNDCRLLGLEITCGRQKILLINCYLPYCSNDNLEEFMMYLSKIDSIFSASNTVHCMAIGDFNADLSRETVMVYLCTFLASSYLSTVFVKIL